MPCKPSRLQSAVHVGTWAAGSRYSAREVRFGARNTGTSNGRIHGTAMPSDLDRALDSARLYLDSLQREQDDCAGKLATVAPGPEYGFILSRMMVLDQLVDQAKRDIAVAEKLQHQPAFVLPRRLLKVPLRTRRSKSA